MRSSLTLAETKAMLVKVAQGMIASQALLTEADRVIGDGDHGVGMGRGFEAVLDVFNFQEFADLKELFYKTGMTLITSVGGASGIIFGSWFTGASKGLVGRQEFDSQALSIFLHDGLKAIQARGKAKAGDKTMVDALLPACAVLDEHTEDNLPEALQRAVQAAKSGADSTKEMVAGLGKARSLGPRALGYIDPGALSASLILEFMLWYVESLPE
jgi:phosphoenolpyruvate---glycerone phosphotransferase subunit DhaL